MIRMLHCSTFCSATLIFFLLHSGGLAKVLAPEQKDKKEILIIEGKRRTYYQLHKDELVYNLEGPLRLEIITRRAVPRRDNRLRSFGYSLVLDEKDELQVIHKQKRSKGVTSPQHPGHGYTRSEKYYLNIPKGHHTLVLRPLAKRNSPVLVRLLTKRFEKSEGGHLLVPEDREIQQHLQVERKKYRYYELIPEKKITIDTYHVSKVLILSRLVFADGMSAEENYRLRIWRDGKLLGTYFFMTEKSEVSTILEDKTVVPGKRRTCEIAISEGGQKLTVELLDKGKRAYIRCVGYD
ncbi:MAG: hypothetical protein ACE5EE_04355 [Fidelibacterota bacterium]